MYWEFVSMDNLQELEVTLDLPDIKLSTLDIKLNYLEVELKPIKVNLEPLPDDFIKLDFGTIDLDNLEAL